MEDIFPKKEGIDYSKLKTTEEGSYSVTRRRDAYKIIAILKTAFNNTHAMTITDSTACIGGDTINFALHFQHVDSIELNQDNYEVLKNNVLVYGLKNVTLYNADATNIFNWNTDVLYVDPPWGGPGYKTKTNLDLFLSEKRLDLWIEEILLRKTRPKHIVLKLPSNYNFSRLSFLANIQSYQIRTYVLVIITVDMSKTDN
jgi:hypothetical protein